MNSLPNHDLEKSISSIRFTETSNPLSSSIDASDPLQCLDILHSVDSQLFSTHIDSTFSNKMPLNFKLQPDTDGNQSSYSTLYGSEFKKLLVKWIDNISLEISPNSDTPTSTIPSPPSSEKKHSKTLVILSGAGTSGRIALYISIFLNNMYPGSEIRCEPLIAGGPDAFVQAQEAAEDDPQAAITDLNNLMDTVSATNIIFIGITCGLSAIYVGQQLHYLMDIIEQNNTPQSVSVSLLGFNPLSQARKTIFSISNQKTVTFFSIVEKMKNLKVKFPNKIYFLTPIIGSEAITGSTRMKGGTATLIILATILDPLFQKQKKKKNQDDSSNTMTIVSSMLQDFKNVFENFYVTARDPNASQPKIPEILQQAAPFCRDTKKTLHYISKSLFPIIDASECPPTFGADPNQVRGFIPQSWSMTLSHLWYFHSNDPKSKKSIEFLCSNKSQRYGIDIETFTSLNSDPTSLVLNFRFNNHQNIITDSKIKKTVIHIPPFPKLHPLCQVLYLKLFLNAITVYGFISAGKVFSNFMCDLKLTNIKLYQRAVFLAAKLAFNTFHPTLSQLCTCEFQILRICYHHSLLEFPLTLQHIPKVKQSEQLKPDSDWNWKPQILPLLPEYDSSSILSLTAHTPLVVSLTILAVLMPTKTISELQSLIKQQPNIRKTLLSQGISLT